MKERGVPPLPEPRAYCGAAPLGRRAYLASIITPEKGKDLSGLTICTINDRGKA